MSREYDVSSHPRLIEDRQKRKKIFYRKCVIFSLFFISLVVGLSYFSGYHTIVINEVEIEGNNITNTDKIKSVVSDTINGRYLYLFKKSNIFIYPKDEIINNLEKKFPRIKEIEIKAENFTSLKISIKEREGSMLWCGEKFIEDSDEECFFINSDGYIFDKAPFFSGNIYFKFYSSLDDSESSPLGNTSLGHDQILEILSFVGGLEDLSFEPAMIDLSDTESQIIYLKRDSLKLPQIIFKHDNNKEEIINNLASSMEQEIFVNEIRGKYESLDYIDLRYKNKVIYKHYE